MQKNIQKYHYLYRDYNETSIIYINYGLDNKTKNDALYIVYKYLDPDESFLIL